MKKSNLLFTFVLILLMVVTIGSISAGAEEVEEEVENSTPPAMECACDLYGIHIAVYLDDEQQPISDAYDDAFTSVYAKLGNTTYTAKKTDIINCTTGDKHGSVLIIYVDNHDPSIEYDIYVKDNIQGDVKVGTAYASGLDSYIDDDVTVYVDTAVDIFTIDYYTVDFYNRDTGKHIDTQYVLKGEKIDSASIDKSKYTTTFYLYDTNTVYKTYYGVYEPLKLDVEWTITGQVLAPAASETTAWYDVWWNTDNSSSTTNYTSIFDAFTDIDNHWARNQIEFCVKRGLFVGTSATTFGPGSYMTNGMLMTVLYRNSGSPAADVNSEVYYAAPMAWGASFITSYGDELIDPNANGTREQLIYMIYNYAISCGIDVSATADLSAYADAGDVTYEKAMQWAVSVGIIEGKPDSLLDAAGNVTRAEVAAIMQRFITWAGF